jgi:hypothetical protein
MAKIFKLSAYLTDIGDDFDEQSLEDYLNYCLRDELVIDHVKLECADIGEWDDELPINYLNCPEEEFEKYFKEE